MGDEEDQKLKLYIRLPFKILEEQQVKDLHPDIIEVYLPRQKGDRRWCIVTFTDKETFKSVNSQLRGKKINGKSIFCRPARKGKKVKRTEKKPEVLSGQTESLLDLIK